VSYLSIFGKLNSQNHIQTSPETNSYNCIAWAAGEDHRWWQPNVPAFLGYYWPSDAPSGMHIDCLIGAFQTLGYAPCANGSHEAGMEKVALYAKPDGTWSHAARQLGTGKWTSKLGKLEDIQHDDPAVIEGRTYGAVSCYMSRKAFATAS
jgi:hypothetical protein